MERGVEYGLGTLADTNLPKGDGPARLVGSDDRRSRPHDPPTSPDGRPVRDR
jgi:hypothetical protein